jgi:hypothetical protein
MPMSGRSADGVSVAVRAMELCSHPADLVSDCGDGLVGSRAVIAVAVRLDLERPLGRSVDGRDH